MATVETEFIQYQRTGKRIRSTNHRSPILNTVVPFETADANSHWPNLDNNSYVYIAQLPWAASLRRIEFAAGAGTNFGKACQIQLKVLGITNDYISSQNIYNDDFDIVLKEYTFDPIVSWQSTGGDAAADQVMKSTETMLNSTVLYFNEFDKPVFQLVEEKVAGNANLTALWKDYQNNVNGKNDHDFCLGLKIAKKASTVGTATKTIFNIEYTDLCPSEMPLTKLTADK